MSEAMALRTALVFVAVTLLFALLITYFRSIAVGI